MQTVLVSVVLYLLILGGMSIVFYFDLEKRWCYETIAGFFDKVPSMSEEAKKQEQLKKTLSNAPAIYVLLCKHWRYFLVGIPLLAILIGGILSFYRSVTIATLILYHFCFSFFTLCLVLLAMTALLVANTPFVMRGL